MLCLLFFRIARKGVSIKWGGGDLFKRGVTGVRSVGKERFENIMFRWNTLWGNSRSLGEEGKEKKSGNHSL